MLTNKGSPKMLKFLKIFVPAGTGVASVLALAYVAADQFVS